MERDGFYEYVGLTSLLTMAAVLIYMVQKIVASSEFCEQLESLSPLLFRHIDVTAYAVQGLIFLIFLAIPPYLMSKDMNTDNSRLSIIGLGVSISCIALTIAYMFFKITSLA